jgi:hypothetical protein
VERFVTEAIPRIPWFRPDGKPDPAWRLFTAPSRYAARAAAWDAARDAARAAAWDAAWAAAWDAARAAALVVSTEHVCAGLPLEDRHREHARARWRVWEKGYALLGDVDGVLYVYAKEAGR